FGWEGLAVGAAGGGGGGGGGGGAVDTTTNVSMSGISGRSSLMYRIGIASITPRTMTCAAVEMSTGMLLRCGGRRRSPVKSSNIARLRHGLSQSAIRREAW